MKRLYFFISLFFFASIKVEAITTDSLKHKYYIYTDIMNFARFTSLTKEVGTVNPDNRVADINTFDLGFYLRPDITYKLVKDRTLAELSVKPRLNLAKGEGFFFQEFKLKWQITNDFYFVGGRYLKELGTAILITPSNPFIFNSTFLNPKIEQKPLNFAELNYSKGDWNFSFFTNYGKANNPNYETPLFDFHSNYGVFIERFKESENSGLVFNLSKEGRFHLGVYNFKTVSPALLIWADVAIAKKVDRFYPVEGHWTSPALIDYDMINGEENNNLFFTGIVGLSYTLKSGPNIKVEYLYNEKGYKSEEFNLFNDMINASSRYNFDLTKDLANINLARAINPGMPFIRRNYLFLQLGGSGLFDKIDYNTRLLYCMDDFSAQFSTLFEWNISTIQLFALSVVNLGQRQSDLKRLINSQIMLGIIYRI